MRSDPSFERRWEEYTGGEFLKRARAEQDDCCPYARRFALWTAELVATATKYPDVVAINQAKVLLLDKYFEWRAAVPKAHREKTGRTNGHTCIFHVFADAYQALKVTELSLTPPLLFLPAPPPAPPPPPQIAGIFLGEIDGA